MSATPPRETQAPVADTFEFCEGGQPYSGDDPAVSRLFEDEPMLSDDGEHGRHSKFREVDPV